MTADVMVAILKVTSHLHCKLLAPTNMQVRLVTIFIICLCLLWTCDASKMTTANIFIRL